MFYEWFTFTLGYLLIYFAIKEERNGLVIFTEISSIHYKIFKKIVRKVKGLSETIRLLYE